MKYKKIILIIICAFILTGCNSQGKLLLVCHTTIEEEKEEINIKFYSSNYATRTVKVKKKRIEPEEIAKKAEALKQNYCNNQIKEDYSCEVEEKDNKLILTEEGESKVIMGEVKDLKINQYKNNLEKKGFTCKSS